MNLIKHLIIKSLWTWLLEVNGEFDPQIILGIDFKLLTCLATSKECRYCVLLLKEVRHLSINNYFLAACKQRNYSFKEQRATVSLGFIRQNKRIISFLNLTSLSYMVICKLLSPPVSSSNLLIIIWILYSDI